MRWRSEHSSKKEKTGRVCDHVTTRVVWFSSQPQLLSAGKIDHEEALVLLGQTDVGAPVQLQQCAHADTSASQETHKHACVFVCVCLLAPRANLTSSSSVGVKSEVEEMRRSETGRLVKIGHASCSAFLRLVRSSFQLPASILIFKHSCGF